MISVTDLRSGTKVEMDGGLWETIDYMHQKIGRGGAKVVTKFRSLDRFDCRPYLQRHRKIARHFY